MMSLQGDAAISQVCLTIPRGPVAAPFLIQEKAMKGHQKGANDAPASVILFGVDDHDKARAAVFQGKTADAARKAADQLKLRALVVTTADAQTIAAKLPAGRLQADGQGLVPYVRRDLYDQVVAIADAAPTPQAATADTQTPAASNDPPAANTAPGLPRTWEEIAAGHVVIAQDDYADEGWWEAIVVDRKNDVLTLRWRDYPKYKPFVRHVAAVALLNTATK
jgi:hypothetical protein